MPAATIRKHDMSHYHAVVWLDHQQAKVFHVGAEGADAAVLRQHGSERHIHHKANSTGSGHVHENKAYLGAVTHSIADAGEILIIGPAGAKQELAKFLEASHPAIAKRVVGVEAADHPSDREIIALARKHFKLEAPRAASAAGHASR
jgi:stalled ribosome rescue protein Dom34